MYWDKNDCLISMEMANRFTVALAHTLGWLTDSCPFAQCLTQFTLKMCIYVCYFVYIVVVGGVVVIIINVVVVNTPSNVIFKLYYQRHK